MLNVEIPIVEVTVLEDRGKIKREAVLNVKKGQHSIVVNKVAPVIVNKSLYVYSENSGVKILNSHIEREYKIQNKNLPEDAAVPERELIEIKDKLELLNSSLNKHMHEYGIIKNILENTFAEIPRDIANGVEIGNSSINYFNEFQEKFLSTQADIRLIESEIAELKEEEYQKEQHLASVSNPSTYQDTSILIDLFTESDEAIQICIEYLVPSAFWRPSYRCELIEARLLFTTQGCIWQNTGEEWKNVKVQFSTQRTSLGINPPVLSDDIISIQKKQKQEVLEIREELIEDSGLGSNSAAPEDLPGIDDSGFVQLIPGLDKVTIPSNGRPYKVETGGFKTKFKDELIAFPELSKYVFSRTIAKNIGKIPILAGPVDLIRNNCFIGKTSILFISQDEEFHIAWGPDPSFRINRSKSIDEIKSNALSTWEEKRNNITICISNIGSDTKEIKIQERIPVSEVESVIINLDEEKLSKKIEGPDSKGMVSWKLTLGKYEHNELNLHYVVKKKKKVTGV